MKNVDKNRADLANEIGELESALSDSYQTLDMVTEEGLVDFYTYMIKAYEAKHRYLLRKLKEC
ncbi:MAG: DUF2508 family protein [Clostridia bacterium]|nr:DUF2508 family protein [Clostridia bacterium]